MIVALSIGWVNSMKKIIELKKIIVILSVLAFSACASKSTQSNSSSDDEVSTQYSGIDRDESLATKVEKSEAPKSTQKPSSDLESNLNAALKRQNESEMIKASQEILLVNPANPKALNTLGMVNYKRGKYKASEYFIKRALKDAPNVSALYNNLGLVQLAQGEEREAIVSFKKGYQMNSSDAALGANLGALYVKNKDFKNAEYALESAYKKNPKDQKIASNYAAALAANKKFPEATVVYEKALSENQSSRDIMLNYAIHQVENLKQYQKGLDLINRLKFVGAPSEARNLIKDLENKAKAGLK